MISTVVDSQLKEYYDVMIISYRDAEMKAGFPGRGRGNSFSYDDLVSSYHGDYKLFHKRVDGKIVGILRVQLNEDTCRIKDIAILPEYQRLGYGRDIIDFIKLRANELGAYRIELGLFDDNKELKQWYENRGFTSVRTKTYENSPHIIRIMEYIL